MSVEHRDVVEIRLLVVDETAASLRVQDQRQMRLNVKHLLRIQDRGEMYTELHSYSFLFKIHILKRYVLYIVHVVEGA